MNLPEEQRELLEQYLLQYATWLREVQEADYRRHHTDEFAILACRERSGAVKLVWESRRQRTSKDYTVTIYKIEGVVGSNNYQGVTDLGVQRGDGQLIDGAIKEGQCYLYLFDFSVSDLTEQLALPVTIPIWGEKQHEGTYVDKLIQEAEDFLEVEETLDEIQRKAKQKIENNARYTCDERKYKLSRIDGFFRALRQKMG